MSLTTAHHPELIQVLDGQVAVAALSWRRMVSLVESVLGLEAGEVCAGSRLREDFGVDQLDLLELAIAMEAELGIEIPDRDLESVITVEDLFSLVGSGLSPVPSETGRRLLRRPPRLPPRERRATTFP